MYKIIGADGKEYGPVTLEQLKNWLAQGRISAKTRVQVQGSSDWRAAGDVPELAGLFAATNALAAGSEPPLIPEAPQAPKQRKGMAIVSFVLGLCSFLLCLSVLTGIPAIILGHIARHRARRSPERYAGRGFASVGLTLGYLSIFIAVIMVSILQMRQAPFRPRPGPPPLSDCQNNLRQVGLAFKVWALEHNDQFPFNVSTNLGGSLELSARDGDGFEIDPAPHLVIISNELSTPGFLLCPKDSRKRVAADFGSLRSDNISYRLRTGASVNADNPQEVLAVCPFHGNVLYCDGNVRKKPR